MLVIVNVMAGAGVGPPPLVVIDPTTINKGYCFYASINKLMYFLEN